MVILALDTTTRKGSVAVRRDGQLLVSRTGDQERTHGERLPGDLLAALREARMSLTDVDRFAVVSGPGSFTGLRVGLATIQGLALGCGRDVVSVPTLEAMAYAALWSCTGSASFPRFIIPWMNAYRGEVFSAIYEIVDGPRLTEQRAATVGSPVDVILEWRGEARDANCLVTGDAVESDQSSLEVNLPGARLDSRTLPLAAVVAQLGDEAGKDITTSPHAVRPVYVRRPDAELARERRRQSR